MKIQVPDLQNVARRCSV